MFAHNGEARAGRLDFFQNPPPGRRQVAVVAVETAVEDVLERARPLATKHRIAFHGEEILNIGNS